MTAIGVDMRSPADWQFSKDRPHIRIAGGDISFLDPISEDIETLRLCVPYPMTPLEVERLKESVGGVESWTGRPVNLSYNLDDPEPEPTQPSGIAAFFMAIWAIISGIIGGKR